MIGENKDILIDKLGFSSNTFNVIKKYNISNLGELMQLSIEEILGIDSIDKYVAVEILDVIKKSILGEIETDLNLEAEINDVVLEKNVNFNKHNNTTQEKKIKVLHYLDETTISEDVHDTLFYDSNGFIMNDIDVNDMRMSARATGALLRNKYMTAKSIVNTDYKDFLEVKGMGAGTREEILNKLKEIICIQYKADEHSHLIDLYSNRIKEDIKINCPDLDDAIYSNQVKVIVYKNRDLLESDIEMVWGNRNLLNKIFSDVSIFKLFENYICSLLQETAIVPMDTLKKMLPFGLCSSDIFMEIIEKLKAQDKVDYTDDGLQYHLLTVQDYTDRMEEGNQKTALMCRLKGMTLEETGSIIGITRERVRQITKKAIENMPKLREDDFKYWFENYDITKEEFKNIFSLSEESFNYLKGTYKKGSKGLEELLNDEHISGTIAQKAVKEMYKYCVVIGGEYIPIKREAIIRKLLEINYSDQECTISEYYQLYMDFLKMNGLENVERLLYPTERAFEARMDDQCYVLSKYGHRIRYYNMQEYDLDRLFAELGFDSFQNMEISTLKMFNVYPELMEEFNIMDEYELHNIIKKNIDKLPINLSLGRMPFISIGESDREQQTVEFLYRVAPIEFYAFGKAYEEEFGVKSETALANFTPFINKYYNNGMFSVDYKIMSDAEYKIMGNKLIKDFYFIEDIENIYMETFPKGDKEKVNPYTLKTMGFQVYIDYVIKNTYPNGEEYFKALLLKDEITDLDMFDRRIKYNQNFAGVLEGMRINCDILEFVKNKYLTYGSFSEKAPDISQEDLKQYAFDAAQYDNEEFFSIKSIRKNGFTSKLDKLGYDDWFYGALLRGNKEIRYSKVGGGFLFSHIGRQFTRADFFLFIMKKLKKIDIMEFIEFIQEEYGLNFDRYDITPIIGQSSMYYDSKREKIYMNKEVYYDDI
ncbi:DNA-directed RNA polymerase subunit alpha C-terminal domain-containing protein [Robinsoniella peoriensis]|uniref:DNA-directed RNA polymerase subunit alpha C-terminal domain-containing protein n=1 Tax=Robinsoniella peoriensis TaxID=180332 RepID=UPI0005C7C246|nr:DNA-directed RNA polymerase subunit alpha C-terminal domain-containing protein [Robinsoniella peoriensis]